MPKADERTEDVREDGKNRKELAQGKSYCEYDNCYELLGVSPTSGPIPIKRAYRKLAAKYHPDRCPGGDLAECKRLFPKYANALIASCTIRTFAPLYRGPIPSSYSIFLIWPIP